MSWCSVKKKSTGTLPFTFNPYIPKAGFVILPTPLTFICV